jgi:pimeloyl-ACP methyl ester carboxylesterase
MSSVNTASKRSQAAPSRDPQPCDVVEAELLRIWSRIVPRSRVGALDDFCSIEGAAARLDRVISAIEDVYGRKFSRDMVLANPTIRGIARLIRQQTAMQFASPLEAIQTGGDAPTIFAIPPNASPGQTFTDLSRQLGTEQPFYGLKPLPPDGSDVPCKWMTTTAAHYVDEIIRVQPTGGCALIGQSWGAYLAFEVAQQLHARGRQVEMLALLDCGPPLIRSVGFHLRTITFKARMGWRNFRRRCRGQFPIEYAVIPNHSVHFDLVFTHKRPTAGYDQLVWDANLRGAAEYVCRPYDGPITLIHSEAFAQSGGTGREDWSELCGGNLCEHVVSGQKDSLHTPAIAQVASALQSALGTNTDC